jgi:hypothetical protein
MLWVVGLLALAAQPDWYYAKLDTNPRLPTNKLFYLEQKAGLCPRPTDQESLNVRMVGKWGGGPSWGVTGKDTLVYLSRGSEVVVINFADTANPKILNYIQAKRLAGRPVLVDTLLYLVTSGYIEVFNVKDPTNAPRVGRLATPVNDIDVEDTLLYSISDDTFRVFNFADPANPHLVGVCADSGYALDYEGGYAYLRDRWGMYILDVRDPTNPHRIASWGTDIAGLKVRGHHCYVAQGSAGSGNLYVLNVSNPASPWQEGVLSGLTGEDICLVDTLLFMPGFDVVNIADSSRPTLVATTFVGGPRRACWADDSLRLGFVAADYAGLHALGLANLANPVLDTTLLGVGEAVDISVAGQLACVACFRSDAVLFDISNPSAPRELGRYTAPGQIRSVVNAESLAYVPAYAHTQDTVLQAVDISDPSKPVMVGAAGGWEDARAMVLRDSLLYCAEAYKFEVFSIANPRQPVWIGNCNLQEASADVVVRDTLAYVANLPSSIVSVVNPSQPVVVGTIASEAGGIAVYDTFAYLAVNYGGLKVWSIANPYTPYRIDTIPYPRGYDVEVADSMLLYGGLDFRALNLAEPAHPPEGGFYATPYRIRKLTTNGGYVYCACFQAGIAVLELLPSGIGEAVRRAPERPARACVVPNPTTGNCELQFGGDNDDVAGLYDVAGKAVTADLSVTGQGRKPRTLRLGLGGLASGTYFLRLVQGHQYQVIKVVKE